MVEPQITNPKIKSSYMLDLLNVVFCNIIIYALIYKTLSDVLNIWFLLKIVLFNVMLN